MNLLERDLHLKALHSALSEAEYEGRVALVYGEAGIGKTSLVEQFLKENTETWKILKGGCDSLFTPRPLGPLYDIASQTQENLLTLLDSQSNRQAIFTACLNELKTQKTILVIEDIHWADEATLDLLKYVGRRIKQTTSLMILTYRDDEIGTQHPLRFLLGDFATSNILHRIPVSSLTNEAVRELAQDKNIDSIELHRLTNGNPFFVTETLATDNTISETVRDAVLARAMRLSPSARECLETVAVIGSRAEAWLLSKISVSNVEECISKGMLQSHDDYYVFRHELARQAILESISPQRKIELHRMMLKVLKASLETRNDVTRLANHAEGTKDANLIFEYAPIAAKQASALGAHRQAAAHYKIALQYTKSFSTENHAQLLDDYADECSLINERLEAKQAQKQALQLWQELGQFEKEGRAFRRLAEIDHDMVLDVEREENIKHAIAILQTLPPSKELARAYSHMARFNLVPNKTSYANPIPWGLRAIELAEKLDDIETLVHALNTIGAREITIGKRIDGQAKLKRSLQLALEHDLQFHVARAYGNLVNELMYARDYEASLRYAEMGIQYCTQHDIDYWLGAFITGRSHIKFQQGYWAEAEQDIQSIFKRRQHEAGETFEIESIFLQLQIRRGDSASLEIISALRETMPKINDLEAKCLFAALLAERAWLNNDLQQCRVEAEPTFIWASQNYNVPYDLDSFSALSYWMWRVGAIKESPLHTLEQYASQINGDWKKAASIWEKFGCPYEQGMALMGGDEAAQLTALEIFERLGARPISEILKQKMRDEGLRIPRGPRPITRENKFGLTSREMEVLTCLSKGSSNQAIAKQLSLSTRTVEHHIASILQKMEVDSRNEAIALALKNNLAQ